ncbi:glycosyltransferase [candidate division KSB1 bacterium]|nr:glycosyltransferase [candidate division KSB1 bacterium]
MDKRAIRVLHVDTERGWRGGQQQAAYLFKAMYDRGYQTAMACRTGSKFERYCRNEVLPYIGMGMRSEFDLISAHRIARVCQREKFQILHLHSAHALSLGLLARVLLPGLRLIAVRRVDFHLRNNLLSTLKYRTRYVDKIICISDAIQNVLIADGVPANKLITIHSGVDFDKFTQVSPPSDFKRREGLPVDHIIVGTIAAIVGHKDYPNLLHAARIALDSSDNMTFCAIGDGTDRDDVHQLARDLKLGTRFIFKGYREDIGEFLKSFDIFVLASKLEGMGTSILDAQAVGLPVIATCTGGIPEIIEDGINGLLVPPRDPSALGNAILSLAENKNLRRRLGENAADNRAKFDISVTVENNLALYDQLLSE